MALHTYHPKRGPENMPEGWSEEHNIAWPPDGLNAMVPFDTRSICRCKPYVETLGKMLVVNHREIDSN